MSLRQKSYSILVVSASEKLNASLAALLPEMRYHPVDYAGSVSAGKRALAERDYDFLIINAPLPDESGSRFAIDCASGKSTAVLLLVRSENHPEVYDRVAEHGVFTLPKPITRPTMETALLWLASARERLRMFEASTLSIEEKMEEIRLVNRAKWLLIRELTMDEATAHRYIEKQAMDRCISKRELASEIIKMYS